MRGVARNPWMVWCAAVEYNRDTSPFLNLALHRSLVDHTRRCLDLWNKDPTLLEALEVANRMQPALWAIVSMSCLAKSLYR